MVSLLDRVRIKLHQQAQAHKHPGREIVDLGPDFAAIVDDFIETEWVKEGMRDGKIGIYLMFYISTCYKYCCAGEFWNKSKLDLVQAELDKWAVPQDYISMRVKYTFS